MNSETMPSPLVAIDDEPPRRLIVDPPLARPLAEGRVFLQYRTEHVRIVSVFGTGALAVSPRIGHVHVTVDGAPWHLIHASGENIVVVDLPPSEHQLLVEPADLTHRVIDRQCIRFSVPNWAAT
ncbi:DUF6130 family protein [Sphingomonas sp. UYP23]